MFEAVRGTLVGICVGAAALACGCGGKKGPDLIAVSGTVTLDGAPLENARIMFVPAGNQRGATSTGKTDSAGRFTLQFTGSRKGALPGKHRVVIEHYVLKDGSTPVAAGAEAEEDFEQLITAGEAKQQLDAAYSDPAKSTLEADVSPAKTTFDFPLKSKP